MLELLLIALVITYCIEVSGFWNEFTSMVSGWLTNGKIKKPIELKPFSCPKCLTFWTGMVWLLATGTFTVPMIAYVCLLSYMTTVFSEIMYLMLDIMKYILNKITKLIEQ